MLTVRKNFRFLLILWFFVICGFVPFQNFSPNPASTIQVQKAIDSVQDDKVEARAAKRIAAREAAKLARQAAREARQAAKAAAKASIVKASGPNSFNVKNWTQLQTALAKAVAGDATFSIYLTGNIVVPSTVTAPVIDELDGSIVGNNFTVSGVQYPFIGTISQTGNVSGVNISANINLPAGLTFTGVGAMTEANYGTISGCQISGQISAPDYYYVGGVAGWNYGTIQKCSVSAAVSGDSLVGGVVGTGEGGAVTNCSATGSVTGVGDFVGGLVGYLANLASVNSSSTSVGTVSGPFFIGGLVGYMVSGSTVTMSSSSMTVTGQGDVGGLVGGINDPAAIVSYSHATGGVQTSGQSAGGFVGKLIDGQVHASSSTGSVAGGPVWTGGFVGYLGGVAAIFNSMSSGSVSSAGYRAAAFAGSAESLGVTVTNCYTSGSLSASTTQNGGMLGYNLGTVVGVVNGLADQPMIGLAAVDAVNSYSVGTIPESYATVISGVWDTTVWTLDTTQAQLPSLKN